MRRTIVIICIAIASIALTAGAVKAASAVYDTLTIGKQGTGGVTYFNGTMKNNTTTNGADNPVTIGDNLRIDGRVYRGATAGTGDTLPFIVNDNMEVSGSLTVTGNMTFNGATPLKSKVYTGTIDVTQSGDDVASTTEASCPLPTGLKSYSFHYKKVAVAEVDLNNLPDIRVIFKSGAGFPYDMRPNSGDVWSSAGYYLSQGYVYIYYKMAYNYCDGTVTPANYTTGDYKIILNY
jgi:hypothetical protein